MPVKSVFTLNQVAEMYSQLEDGEAISTVD